MRALGLIVGGMLALTASIAGDAAPLASSMKQLVPASGTVHVWGGCGWGWHPVPGHWSRWRGGWVPYGAGQGPYGVWRPYGDWGGSRQGWYSSGEGS